MLGLKICHVSKLFVSKKIMVQDIQGQGSKPKFLSEKKLWSTKNFGAKPKRSTKNISVHKSLLFIIKRFLIRLTTTSYVSNNKSYKLLLIFCRVC